MYKSQEIGKIGEYFATKYIEKLGYIILERNFRCRQGEIDIIAKNKEEIVFIEVKTRTSCNYGKPIEAVTITKQQHIEKAAQYYLYKKHLENAYVRIDVIEVYIKKDKFTINHIKEII